MTLADHFAALSALSPDTPVRLYLDEGDFLATAEEALDEWHALSPGEHFDVTYPAGQ